MNVRGRHITDFARAHDGVVLVTLKDVRGSAPRDTDAFMLVALKDTLGTIGGGQLEYIAIDTARSLLRAGDCGQELDVPLGPEIGQCCGGRVKIALERLDAATAAKLAESTELARAGSPHVYVFGAGHVGRALARALAPLPFVTTIADTRPDALDGLPSGVDARLAAVPEALVRAAHPQSAFAVLTHDHALDFLVMAEILNRGDAAYAGMIGSKTKRAQFRRWYLGEGGAPAHLSQLTCPIGAQELGDKRPEIIAALTAAEIIGKLSIQGCTALEKSATLHAMGAAHGVE